MGSFVAILLVISILGESALLYIHIYDHNLLWYLGIFSAAYAGARALVCETLCNLYCDHDLHMNLLIDPSNRPS